MTAMPQMVALFNGVGGGAAALISLAEFHGRARLGSSRGRPPGRHPLLGARRLDLLLGQPRRLREAAGAPQRSADHVSRAAGRQRRPRARIGALVVLTATAEGGVWLALLLVGGFLLGIVFVLPIGGADMPVVISLLNAFTGLAAAATGFVLHSRS